MHGHIEVIRELLSRGADVNKIDNYKRKRGKDGHH